MKNLSYLACTAILACMSAGFTPAQAKDAKDISIGLIPKGPIPWFDDCNRGAKAEAAKLGVQYQWIVPVNTQGSSQVTVIEQLMARKVDGIGISVDEPKSVEGVLKKFIAGGGKVFTYDSDSPNSGRSAFIGTNNFAAGEVVGDAMGKALGGKGDVGIITGELGAVDQNARISGFKKALEKYPDVKVIALEGTNDDLSKAVPVTEALLRAHPNINGLFGVSQVGGPAIAKTLQENEFHSKKGVIKVLTFDDLADTLRGVKEGFILSTTVQRPTTMCTLVVDNLVSEINGKPSDPKGIDTGVTLVGPDNLTTYTK
jgi:ribose transport system substrate-binding protein